jgi:hypothetical protein
MSGSVIGGVEDLGAVFYNPGRLAVISNSAFLLSANVYEYNSIQISNAFGSSKNASRSDFKGVPTLAAGTFKIKRLPKHHFAYAIMTRQNTNLNFSYRNEIHADVFATLPGDEYFGAEVSINQQATEQWIGVTWSYSLSKKVSIGLTTNYTINNQSKGGSNNLQVLSQANEVGIYRFNRSFTLNQTGLIWKAGFAGILGKWRTGVTVTTPVLQLASKGAYRYEEFYSSVPGISTRPETYSSNYQEGLDPKVKTPWAIGFGFSRPFGKNTLHLSTEWFSSIPKYSTMKVADHTSQSNPNDTIRFELVDQARGVWNAGIGMEIYLSEKVQGYASFSTDFANVPSDLTRFIERKPEANFNSWNANFYHVGAGVVLKLKGADITLGATHTGADLLLPRAINFPDGSGQGIFDETQTSDLRWDRWRFIFSFSFPFLKDYAAKLSGEKADEKK